MDSARQELAKRIRALRRRHFGARGQAEFAARLNLPLEEYVGFERGQVPPGQLLVRMCEMTGEDLQWLLTGVAARSTVVISGARSRHQGLLTRLAQELEDRPEVAGPIEALLDLLRKPPSVDTALLEAAQGCLIPVLPQSDVPDVLEHVAMIPRDGAGAISTSARLYAPAGDYSAAGWLPVRVLRSPESGGIGAIQADEVCDRLPEAWAVELTDSDMRPMFEPGDAVIVVPGATARPGAPCLVRTHDAASVRCRIWLGYDADTVSLGCLLDGRREQIDRGAISWSLEALFRVSTAA